MRVQVKKCEEVSMFREKANMRLSKVKKCGSKVFRCMKKISFLFSRCVSANTSFANSKQKNASKEDEESIL